MVGAAAGFPEVRRLGDAIAGALLPEPILLSWYDGQRDESHPDVHECGDRPGWLAYAESRGGSLLIDFDRGRYVLVYAGTVGE